MYDEKERSRRERERCADGLTWGQMLRAARRREGLSLRKLGRAAARHAREAHGYGGWFATPSAGGEWARAFAAFERDEYVYDRGRGQVTANRDVVLWLSGFIGEPSLAWPAEAAEEEDPR